MLDQGFSFHPGAVSLVGGIVDPEPDQNHPLTGLFNKHERDCGSKTKPKPSFKQDYSIITRGSVNRIIQ